MTRSSFDDFLLGQKGYRRQFLAGHGPGPWPCHFCGESITEAGGRRLERQSLVIHHLDEDRSNGAPSNLVAAHHGCHVSFHRQGEKHPLYGKPRSAETRAKMRESMTGWHPTPEQRAKLSEALRGRPTSPETRAKISAALRGKHRDRRASAEARARMVEAQRNRPVLTCSICGRVIKGQGPFALHQRSHEGLANGTG